MNLIKTRCENYIKDGACFAQNGQKVWGKYLNVAGYDLISNVQKSDCTNTSTKTDPVCPTLTPYVGTYDGKGHTITVSGGSGGTIEYRTSSTGTWTKTLPTREDVGTTTVYVRVKGDTTHNDKDCGSSTIRINSAPVTKTDAVCPTITPYVGT